MTSLGTWIKLGDAVKTVMSEIGNVENEEEKHKIFDDYLGRLPELSDAFISGFRGLLLRKDHSLKEEWDLAAIAACHDELERRMRQRQAEWQEWLDSRKKSD